MTYWVEVVYDKDYGAIAMLRLDGPDGPIVAVGVDPATAAAPVSVVTEAAPTDPAGGKDD